MADHSTLVPDMHYVDGVCLPGFIPETHLKDVKELSLNPDDVIITGYPRSGNNWTVAAVNAILHADNLDEYAKNGPRKSTINLPDFINDIKQDESPRVLLCHFRYRMLPNDVRKRDVKMINIIRDPRDVAVSYYNLYQTLTKINYKGSWDTFLDAFIEGRVIYGSWFDHTQDWLHQQGNPNILYIKYEEFLTDTSETILKMAAFIGKSLTFVQLSRIVNMMSFDSMQNNSKFNQSDKPYFDQSKSKFIRSGKIGEWKKYFTNEQKKNFDAAYEEFETKNNIVQTTH